MRDLFFLFKETISQLNALAGKIFLYLFSKNKKEKEEFESVVDVFLLLLRGRLLIANEEDKEKNIIYFLAFFFLKDEKILDEIVFRATVENIGKNTDKKYFEKLKKLVFEIYGGKIDNLSIEETALFFEFIKKGIDSRDNSYFKEAIKLLN